MGPPNQPPLHPDALPFGRLWYAGPDTVSNVIDYAKFRSRSCDVVIRVYDESGTVIETHEHAGEFRETVKGVKQKAAAR